MGVQNANPKDPHLGKAAKEFKLKQEMEARREKKSTTK